MHRLTQFSANQCLTAFITQSKWERHEDIFKGKRCWDPRRNPQEDLCDWCDIVVVGGGVHWEGYSINMSTIALKQNQNILYRDRFEKSKNVSQLNYFNRTSWHAKGKIDFHFAAKKVLKFTRLNFCVAFHYVQYQRNNCKFFSVKWIILFK